MNNKIGISTGVFHKPFKRNEFWKNWKRKAEIEKVAIKSLEQGKKIILQNIPKKEIVAIYIKGSFVRRELQPKSDIDTVTILKTNKYKRKMEKLDKFKYEYKPPIEFASLSLWELKNNKLFIKINKPRARPDRFVKKLKDYKLIYGRPLKIKEFATRTDKETLADLLKAFNTVFLPLYQKKKMGFSDIIKQVFWLTDLELRIKGKEPPHAFKGIAKLVKNKNHIIHDALRLRIYPTKDKIMRKKFITKLKNYLK